MHNATVAAGLVRGQLRLFLEEEDLVGYARGQQVMGDGCSENTSSHDCISVLGHAFPLTPGNCQPVVVVLPPPYGTVQKGPLTEGNATPRSSSGVHLEQRGVNQCGAGGAEVRKVHVGNGCDIEQRHRAIGVS